MQDMKKLINETVKTHQNAAVHFYDELPKDTTARQPYIYFNERNRPKGEWGIQTLKALEEAGWKQKVTVEEL